MKKLTLSLLVTFNTVIIAQIKVQDTTSTKSPVARYERDMISQDGKKGDFNDKMLNIFFAEKVGTAFGGTNDLSLQKFFASLDAGENSISVGGNFDDRDDELKRLKWVLSTGLKMKAKDKFSTFYKNGDFQGSNIGGFFKVTLIGRGLINYSDKDKINKSIKRKDAIIAYRKHLYSDYELKYTKLKTEEKDIVARQLELQKYNQEAELPQAILDKKSDELYIAMAKDEIKYTEDNKLYRYLWNHWLSADVYIPFGENKYKTTSDFISSPLVDKNFFAISGSLTYNVMWLYSSGESIFLKVKGAIKNNNNIIVDAMTSTPFQTVSTAANNTTVITNTEDGYITNFEKFITPTITIEPAFFTFNNTVGFSPAIEFNAGKYNKTNWKLGIPISLKDKEGKPKVNFELQWKEINTFKSSDHIVGVSVNFLFGDMIN
ncbi:hypothetical protein [Chryseobacterium sp. JAH]|uniref:hypothetical protein n=1 Tax=Chryseobacterium sp. JAH TaxID=1742858 RepID=UPI0006462DF3|nr:hypothetical protein [Chryseobacterium sp. JAH]KUJ49749.1 hypothetical protein AR685_17550 [Chryseobacterium sp. JAH]